MVNPEVVREPTPNGGDYSALYKLDKDGNLAKEEKDVVELRITEMKNDGTLVCTTYARVGQGR